MSRRGGPYGIDTREDRAKLLIAAGEVATAAARLRALVSTFQDEQDVKAAASELRAALGAEPEGDRI